MQRKCISLQRGQDCWKIMNGFKESIIKHSGIFPFFQWVSRIQIIHSRLKGIIDMQDIQNSFISCRVSREKTHDFQRAHKGFLVVRNVV